MSKTDGAAARYLRRAASGALLAAPALTIPALAIPVTAAAAASPAAAAAPSCHQPGHRHAAAAPGDRAGQPDSQAGQPAGHNSRHHSRAKALIGNLNPAPGATVPAAATISFLIAANQPFPAPATRDVTVTVNDTTITATPGPAETGVPVTYASHPGTPPRPASCEIPFTFTLPAATTSTARIQVTAHDADGHTDTTRWTLTIAATTMPAGTIGGITLTAAAGITLLAIQARRRHPAPPPHH